MLTTHKLANGDFFFKGWHMLLVRKKSKTTDILCSVPNTIYRKQFMVLETILYFSLKFLNSEE